MTTSALTQQRLKEAILASVGAAINKGELNGEMPGFTIEIPADRTHGDLATNAAMVSARAFRLAPRKIAEIICENIDLTGTNISRTEIAGPGFINFFYDKSFYADVLNEIKTKGDSYGRSDMGQGKRVLVEFVSANPTGPMHVGNARGGALGDSLSSVLEWAGFDVSREFYICHIS